MHHDSPDAAPIAGTQSGNTYVLRLSGAVDVNNAREWQATLTATITGMPPDTAAVVVDLTGVTLLSAVGARALRAATACVPAELPLTVIAQGVTLRVVQLLDVGRFRIRQRLDDVLTARP